MILIIPALHIAEGRCIRTAEDETGAGDMYPRDPADVARLWRGENAKALHVVFEDMERTGIAAQREMLRRIAHAVDIPIQLAGDISSVEDVHVAISEIGAYRVVIGSDVAKDADLLSTLLERHGPRKIVIALDMDGGTLHPQDPSRHGDEDAVAFALRMKERGVQRLIVTEVGARKSSDGPPTEFLLMLAERTNLSVTLNGSVRHYHDLQIIQDLHPRKIDSIILDEALYSNSFPCQKIWRKAERQLIEQHKLL